MPTVLSGRKSRAALALFLFSLAPIATQAQVLRDEGVRLLEEQRNREREDSLSRPAPVIPRPESPVAPPATPDRPDGPVFQISRIDIVGDTVLSASEKADLVAPFVGTSMGPKAIDMLLGRVTEAYIRKGFVTTRAYLGPQNLASGRLEITVIPGLIEKIKVDGQEPAMTARSAFPMESGEALRMDELEQAVDQINRLRSRRAEAQILPGQSPGGSELSIDTRAEKPWRVSLGVDNFGQTATGEKRQRLGVEFDNLLGLWDAWSLTSVESKNTRSELLSVSVPVGFGTLSYAYAQSESHNLLAGTITMHNHSKSHTLAWNHVVLRNQSTRFALDASLAMRDSQRHLDSIALTPQQQISGRLAGSLLVRMPIGALTADLGYSQGIPHFGGDGDLPNTPRSAPHNQFEKWDSTLGVSLMLSSHLALRSTLAGQFARMGLPGQEQSFYGGASSVRGFKEGVIAGDRGQFMRNELLWTTASSLLLPDSLKSSGVRFDPFISLDAARARLLADSLDQRIASAGFGFRTGWKDIAADFTWARPLTAPPGISREQRLHFSLSLMF
ncbi:hemolysin activation/secretion protein [Azospira oryzae]|uniref:Hemolysin activation/secretion protein n=1 Tax=Azospira oryzae TaxID=146939 RepID=A0ABY0ISK4_9RHOO|nr:hemolysin activation/secretion protein [Azospira oryzae]